MEKQEHREPRPCPPGSHRRAEAPGALSGFTLIELLVALMIMALIVGAAYEVFNSGADDARFQTMRNHQLMLRKAIEQYHARNRRWPPSLESLTQKYLNRVPDDPMTSFDGNDWLLIGPSGNPSDPTSWTTAGTPPVEGIFDVRSSAGY